MEYVDIEVSNLQDVFVVGATPEEGDTFAVYVYIVKLIISLNCT